MGRLSGLPSEWSESLPGERKRLRVALDENHLNIAMLALGVFGSMPNDSAEPIFGQYLCGLAILSKTDMHLGIEDQARAAFINALRRAMYNFGDLESENAELLQSLHRTLARIIPEEAHRNQLFAQLETSGKIGIGEAMAAKRIADLYLAVTARKLWHQFAKCSADAESQIK